MQNEKNHRPCFFSFKRNERRKKNSKTPMKIDYQQLSLAPNYIRFGAPCVCVNSTYIHLYVESKYFQQFDTKYCNFSAIITTLCIVHNRRDCNFIQLVVKIFCKLTFCTSVFDSVVVSIAEAEILSNTPKKRRS